MGFICLTAAAVVPGIKCIDEFHGWVAPVVALALICVNAYTMFMWIFGSRASGIDAWSVRKKPLYEGRSDPYEMKGAIKYLEYLADYATERKQALLDESQMQMGFLEEENVDEFCPSIPCVSIKKLFRPARST